MVPDELKQKLSITGGTNLDIASMTGKVDGKYKSSHFHAAVHRNKRA